MAILQNLLIILNALNLPAFVQEKYQKEQYKLKEEWEKAQREVEEEERRYYEEVQGSKEEVVLGGFFLYLNAPTYVTKKKKIIPYLD